MLRWAIRILSCHPEVQVKVGEELDSVVGKGVEVTWDKRKELPYTMAVMKVTLFILNMCVLGNRGRGALPSCQNIILCLCIYLYEV